MSFIGYFQTCCPTCGEVAKPLPDWEPKVTPTEKGYIVEGTPCYCACNRPAPPTRERPTE
jgi:hypothetical protein